MSDRRAELLGPASRRASRPTTPSHLTRSIPSSPSSTPSWRRSATGARSCCSAMVGAPPKRSMSQPSSSAASPDRESPAWPALALDDGLGSVLTALSNDYAYAEVMARQVKALAHPGDVVVGMSTSGRSSNVVKGLTAARSLGTKTVAFTGAAPVHSPKSWRGLRGTRVDHVAGSGAAPVRMARRLRCDRAGAGAGFGQAGATRALAVDPIHVRQAGLLETRGLPNHTLVPRSDRLETARYAL